MRKLVLLVTPIMMATPFAMSEGQPRMERHALVTAMNSVREDLPKPGRVALAAKGQAITKDERDLAAALGVEARPLSELRQCVPSGLTTGRSMACRLRGVIGTVHVDRVEPAGDTMRVFVHTTVPMTAEGLAPWLYWREYAVDLVRYNGVWQVVRKSVVRES